MQFKKNMSVYTRDNQDIGRIKRVVMDPVTQKVSHVVIRQGLFFTEDKLIPVDYFDQTDQTHDDHAVLRYKSDNLPELPRFEEVEHVPVESRDVEDYTGKFEDDLFYMYWNPPMGASTSYASGSYAVAPAPLKDPAPDHPYYVKRTTQNIPEGTIALEEGAQVYSSDREHVGTIEQIYVNPKTNYATHIMISQGLLLKENRWIPTLWIRSMSEDNVYLGISAATLEAQPAADTA